MLRRVARCARPGNLLNQVPVLPRWGNPPSRDWIRVTSNSCEMLLAEAFFIKRLDIDTNAPGHITERLQQEQQKSVEKHQLPKRRLPVIFLFTCLANFY